MIQMKNIVEHAMIEIPNMLIISGNGRNAGKTTLACKIIQHLSQNNKVTGIKISPHFHTIKKGSAIIKTEKFLISEEKQTTLKDSSLLLQAGANKVYYVIAKQENLYEAFTELLKIIPEDFMVCESGGLREFVEPGIFLFVKRSGDIIVKKHLLNYSPIVVNNDGNNFDFDISRIKMGNNMFRFKTTGYE